MAPAYFLIYWPEELAVTAVESKKVKASNLAVGEECQVQLGKNREYDGRIAAWGWYCGGARGRKTVGSSRDGLIACKYNAHNILYTHVHNSS